MRDAFGLRRKRDAQTLVFFILAFGTIVLLCGLAIDSGLLYLAKARMGRAVDGASLAAVGNFLRDPDPATNRSDVAVIMRNFAVANYTDLGSGPNGGVAATATPTQTPYLLPNGVTAYTYTFNFNDNTQDANGQYKRFVKVILSTGSGGQITKAACEARCPVQTYFIGYAGHFFKDLKVSSSATATRNPRLIMIVVDRSASMLAAGGGAYGLPQAITQFLDFFDTSSDNIGIVSFGSSARLEMPLTTNFIYAGTNVLFDAYQTNSSYGIPGPDPEEFSTNSDYDVNYAYSGVRRLKFGGTTAADEGIRLGVEELMANSGFTDPDVVKYLVLFTDGKWNVARSLLAAPGYTNTITGPPANSSSVNSNFTNTATWVTDLTKDTNLVPVPTFMRLPNITNAIGQANSAYPYDFGNLVPYHTNDVWQSTDGTNEPLSGAYSRLAGTTMNLTVDTSMGYKIGAKTAYTHSLDVWLQPGAVDYVYYSTNGGTPFVYVSDLTNPTKHVNVTLNSNADSNVLVVPGYVVDGLFYDGFDLPYPDNPAYQVLSTYPAYRNDNYNQPFMWPDDATPSATSSDIANYVSETSDSMMRQLMFRNYPNLLTGFYVFRADEPTGLGIEHLITDGPVPSASGGPGAYRSLYGLGPYYPSAGFYWPFDLVGVDRYKNYGLTNATIDPDPTGTGLARHGSYSINMLSSAAKPEWYGELFYKGTGGVSVTTGTSSTAVSSLMGSASDWQTGRPSWMSAFDVDMTSDAVHNSNLAVQVWRPSTFTGGTIIGTTNSFTTATQIINSYNAGVGSATGGYVIDGNGQIYANSMAWSGRPTHYYDFSQSSWVQVADNHTKNIQSLPLGYWKAQEYAWHARAQGVTIYTVGYGYLVSQAQQVVLAQIANATNTTAGNAQSGSGSTFTYTDTGGTNITFNPNQPIGQQFFGTNSTDISNDFYQVGQAINAALTQ